MTWGPLGELGALFSPGMRHEQERRRSADMMREEEGNSADPPNMIDLDSGVVVLGPVADSEPEEGVDPRHP